MTGQPGPLRRMVEDEINRTADATAGVVARGEGREPTVDEAIISLIDVINAQSRVLAYYADVLDVLVAEHDARDKRRPRKP